MPEWSAALIASIATAATLAACGDGAREPSELAGALPGNREFVLYLDLDAAREELGLPADADPVIRDELAGLDKDDPLLEFVRASEIVLPHVTDTLTKNFELGAIAEVDHAEVSAAATGFTEDGPAAVVETDQPFGEIAEALEDAGFERDGEILTGGSADPVPALPDVADLGDGRIVFASSLEDAEEAGSDREDGSAGIALMDELDQPRRVAGTPKDGCITGFAQGLDVGTEVDGFDVETLMEIDGGADPDRVVDEVEVFWDGGDATVGEPVVDGDRLTVTVAVPRVEDATDPMAGQGFAVEELYDCG